MADLICTCACGHKIRVSEFALGIKTQCARCGDPLEISEANTISLEPPPKTTSRPPSAQSTADLNALDGPQVCARCAKPFRGEWDRYSSPDGAVCHVCAHLATPEPAGGPVARPAPLKGTPVPPKPKDAEPEPEPAEPTLLDQFEAFKQTPQFRIGLYVAAFSVIGVAIYYSFFHTFPEPGPASTPETAEQSTRIGLGLLGPPKELTEGQHASIRVMVFVIDWILWSMPRFLAIITTLIMAGGLPGSTWWAGLFHVGILAVVTTLLGYVPVAGFIISLYVLYELYNLSWTDLLRFVVLSILYSMMVWPIRMLVFGLIGAILF